MRVDIKNEADMKMLGARLGALLRAGDVVELIGDVGAGKTTLTKGIAVGLGVDEDVQSPSYTISRLYETAGEAQLAHYDFYRLHDAGIMVHDLQESVNDPRTITVIEWANIVDGVLPSERLSITLTSPGEDVRLLEFSGSSDRYDQVIKELV